VDSGHAWLSGVALLLLYHPGDMESAGGGSAARRFWYLGVTLEADARNQGVFHASSKQLCQCGRRHGLCLPPPLPVRHRMHRSWRRVGRLSCMRMKIEGGKIIEAEETEFLEHQ